MNRLIEGESCVLLIPEGKEDLGYEKILDEYLTDTVTHVCLVDPHVRTTVQLHFFKCFLQTISNKCLNIKHIDFVTEFRRCNNMATYRNIFAEVFPRERLVKFRVSFGHQKRNRQQSGLHDRSLTLNNGVHIGLGRGLDMYKLCSCNKSKNGDVCHVEHCLTFAENLSEVDLNKLKTKETKIYPVRDRRIVEGGQYSPADYEEITKALGVAKAHPFRGKRPS